MKIMRIIDSHTEGEPTRLILDGGPPLGGGSLHARRECLVAQFDDVRWAVAHEGLVGALLCAPQEPASTAGVIFFNEAGPLGMCGHATMGLAVSLYHLGHIDLGRHKFETPVGSVTADLKTAHDVAVENVESYRHRAGVTVEVDGMGPIVGDVAWGGNWFFLARRSPVALEPENIGALTQAAAQVRQALAAQGITGADGAEIDHVEFFGPPQGPPENPGANARNFVLCPDGAYDRSPCGTGTSAKLACLAADGKLAPGEGWVQESITGSRFEARYVLSDAGAVRPTIIGSAYVTGEAQDLMGELARASAAS
ncbi:MAG: hydroxyproline-2-epimerase [Alphaproteobacteria bacterium]|nr:hydroxyproline-2-epimerase [Alphaproteobacteria bacterium]